MKKIRVYLAGPMRNRPHHNFPAFEEAASRLRLRGYIVVSPKELSECFGYTEPREDGSFPNYGGAMTPAEINDFILQDVLAILRSDMVCVLPEWEESAGARMEVAVARMALKPIHVYDRIDWNAQKEFDSNTVI